MIADDVTDETLEERVRVYKKQLEEKHGHLMSGTSLRKILGYKTAAAFRQAYKRDKLPLPVITIPKRRGYFARVEDVAIWLAKIDIAAENAKYAGKP